MSLHSSQKTTTSYRTVKVASPEPVSRTVISAGSASPLPYAVNGSYETVRYLVPMQQQQQQQIVHLQQQPMMQMQQQYVLMQQPIMQQPMMQQMVSPVYLQNLQHLSVSSQESDMAYRQQVEVSTMISLFSAQIVTNHHYGKIWCESDTLSTL